MTGSTDGEIRYFTFNPDRRDKLLYNPLDISGNFSDGINSLCHKKKSGADTKAITTLLLYKLTT